MDKSTISEENFFIPSARGALAAMLHRPAAGKPRCAVVFCHPSFEERKSAYRCMVDAARALAGAGAVVLRFDYFGTGDSEGDHADTNVEAHIEGVGAAAGLLRERFAQCRMGLLGLRLGASYAALAASSKGVDPDFLILWEPVLDGRQLLDVERKRQMVRRMMTEKDAAQAGKGRAGDAPGTTAADVIDMEGYALSRKFREEIDALAFENLLDGRQPGCSAFIVRISFRQELGGELERIVERNRARGINIDTASVVMQPVWNRLDPFDWSPLVAATLRWVEKFLAAEGR